ncbi:MAG TPA: hypothetical protein VJ964_17655 [Balneolaceae bacterium]|nr:hypothetical protein [Balneolaceae bacterium]
MGKIELTKVQALKLITPVVDDEVSIDEREAFLDYIAKHDDVRKKYESVKNIKTLVHSRCPCAKAPDSLKTFLKNIQREGVPSKSEAPIYDVPNSGPAGQDHPSSHQETNPKKNSAGWWLIPLAAGLLIAAMTWGFFNFFYLSSPQNTVYNVEEYTYEHFAKNKGQFVQPTVATASLGSAEVHLASDYNMPMTVPAIQNAELKGIVFREFVPHYKSPMLEYYIPSEGQYIYIFAFKLEKLKKFKRLVRDTQAVKDCTQPTDYHIHKVNGKHVVSWKWNDIWYTAISNNDGKKLASLVKPLQRNKN